MKIAARAPNHLGDGVVALPAMAALARRGSLVIFGPRWAGELYRDLDAEIRPRGAMGPLEAAVLFSPSLRAALEARAARRVVGTPTDGRSWLLTDPVTPGVHPWETYRALASVLGARVDGVPRWTIREQDPEVEVPDGHIGLNPVSASGEMREWPGFGALAARLPYPVVVYGGPGERERVLPRSGGRQSCIGLSLPAFARALSRCALFVSNDSGAAHFARACGAEVLVLYGSTEPNRTGPLGAHALLGPRPPCAPCYGQRCHRQLDCFALPVEQVLGWIEERLGEGVPAEGTVLLRLRALGDVVLLGSITEGLPGPVTVVTEPRYVALAARLRGVDRAVPFGTPVVGRLVDLQRSLRTLAAHPLARKVRKRSLSRWLLLKGMGQGRPSVPELYAQAAGTQPLPPPWLDLPPCERDALVLVPGAAVAPKRWSPGHFSAVGRAWEGPVAVLGGPGEEALCSTVASAIPGASLLCEDGFDQTIEQLSRARVVLAGDTGLMHLGAACGARVVALFGPTHERDGFFPYPDGRVVSLALPCRPCTRHRVERCAEGHHGCMGQDVQTVLEAVRSCAG